MIIKTFVIGKHGFLGSHFFSEYVRQDATIFGTQHVSRHEPFFLDIESATPFNPGNYPIKGHGYTHALIAAASGHVVECERDFQRTYCGNVKGTLSIAKELAHLGITPIVFSTTQVFDGVAGGYDEMSPTSPINAYGSQKADVEQQIDEVCQGNFIVLRLNKVFTLEPGDGTLLDEIATNLLNDKVIYAARDQIFSPIEIEEVIRMTTSLQRMRLKGLFNLSGIEAISRLDLTLDMARVLSKDPRLVKEISLDDLPDKIRRPKRSNLCCEKLFSTGIMPPKPLSYFINKKKDGICRSSAV
jgi:dTDP-4-dehydrorhamnose reductase